MSAGSGKYGTAWKTSRHDNYYHLAKEQGYRSRACFKLIQVNKKFDFLSKSQCCIDLCAAPGSWIQVCTKFMPKGSLLVAVDLFAIKHLPGVVTLQNDITTDACRQALKKELKGHQCDTILHDGAPNSGGATWAKDAYVQNELVVHSLRICTLFLKAGGTFVTKVFRSQDYNAVLWLLKQFFKTTTVTKPASSRSQSAEIFVVCEGYLAPRKVDPKLLDPAMIFKQDVGEQKQVDVFHDKQKRNRGGYDDDMPMTMSKIAKVSEFMEAELPAVFLGEYSSMEYDAAGQIYLNYKESTDEIKELMKDLKVLGKGDFSNLLKYRKKMIQYQKDLLKEQEMEEDEEEPEVELTEQEKTELEEKKITQNLLELKEKLQQKKRREKRKKKEKAQKDARKRELNVHNLDGDADDGELGLFAMKQMKDNEDLQQIHETGDDPLPEDIESSDFSDTEESEEEGSDEEFNRYSRMEKDMDAAYESYKERKKIVAKKTKIQPMESEKEIAGDVADDEDEDSDSNENPLLSKIDDDGEKVSKSSVLNRWFERDLFKEAEKGEKSDSDSDNDFDAKKKKNKKTRKRSEKKHEPFNNGSQPLSQHKRKRDDDDEDDDDDSSDSEGTKKEKNGFEEVPMSDYSSDTDAQAEVMAMGQMMLRKKTKTNMIDSAYNRFAYNDHEELPEWFVTDENQHSKAPIPVTKEMVNNFKVEMKAIDARPIKKVAEAKARKKMKLLNQVEKMKKRANATLENDETTFHNKMKLMHKLAAKKMQKSTTQKDKTYIVSTKSGQHKGKGKGSKGKDVKFVDRRMRADAKGLKRATRKKEKNAKNSGTNKKGKK